MSCSQPPCNLPVYARGICTQHYYRAFRAGSLDDYPRTWRAEELVAEYRHLLAQRPYTQMEAAQRLGVKYSRLTKAIERANKRARQAA